MVHIDIVDLNSHLEPQTTTEGNITRYRADLSEVLGKGEVLSTAVITVTSLTATVSTPVLASAKKSCTFLVTTPDVETFTLTLEVTTSETQDWNFTVPFNVVPVS
jgi:hypothetical protein